MTRRQSKARLAVTIAAACSVAVGAVITGTPAYSEGRGAPGRRPARARRPRPRRRLPRRAGHLPGRPRTQPRLHRGRRRPRDRRPGAARRPGPHRQQQQDVRRGRAAAAGRRGERSTSTRPSRRTCPGWCTATASTARLITVRQVLQHTSGVPNYTAVMDLDFFATRHHYVEPRELLDLALTQPGTPPGSAWSYSNTNYVIAGLIVQKVTGRPLAEVVTDRVIEPLHLRDTYVPGPRRGGAPRAPPARVPRGGAGRRAAGHHRARPVVGLGGRRHRLDPERPRRVLRRPARRRAAAARAPRRRCRRPSRRRRSCTACGTGWRSSAPR